MVDLMDQGTIDRQLLASVLRTSGFEGEQLLIKLLKYHSNEKVRSIVASVLSYRLPEDQLKINIEMEIISSRLEIFDQTKQLRPGQMCIYKNGKISSIIFEQLHKEKKVPFEEPKPKEEELFSEMAST